MLRTDDTQAYIRMDCKRGTPVSALGVGGNWPQENDCSPHLEVAFRPCVSGDLHKKYKKIKIKKAKRDSKTKKQKAKMGFSTSECTLYISRTYL